MHAEGFFISDRDIARWSEPLVADSIYCAYERCRPSRLAASTLGRLHCQVWRCLLDGETIVARRLRQDLVKEGQAHGITATTMDAIDATVIEELLVVVMRRSQRSRAMARSEGMTLVNAASALGEIRAAA
ncbi:MAG TPA: hypothetical protein VED87_09600 [Methylocystis sp.]|nr:hypothetical protein [Methylocystis sp.]